MEPGKQSFTIFLYQHTEKEKTFFSWKKVKSLRHELKRSCYRNNKGNCTVLHAEAKLVNNLQMHKHNLSFVLTRQVTCFNFQQSISTKKTHGSQYYRFFAQAHLYRLCGIWKVSRHIWTVFLPQKQFKQLEYKT